MVVRCGSSGTQQLGNRCASLEHGCCEGSFGPRPEWSPETFGSATWLSNTIWDIQKTRLKSPFFSISCLPFGTLALGDATAKSVWFFRSIDVPFWRIGPKNLDVSDPKWGGTQFYAPLWGELLAAESPKVISQKLLNPKEWETIRSFRPNLIHVHMLVLDIKQYKAKLCSYFSFEFVSYCLLLGSTLLSLVILSILAVYTNCSQNVGSQ